jgi:hypothetical protein
MPNPLDLCPASYSFSLFAGALSRNAKYVSAIESRPWRTSVKAATARDFPSVAIEILTGEMALEEIRRRKVAVRK